MTSRDASATAAEPLDLTYATPTAIDGLPSILLLVAATPAAIVVQSVSQLAFFFLQLLPGGSVGWDVLVRSVVPVATVGVQIASGVAVTVLALRARRHRRLGGVATACAVFAATLGATTIGMQIYFVIQSRGFAGAGILGWSLVQSLLSTLGACIGPLVAYVVLRRWANAHRQ